VNAVVEDAIVGVIVLASTAYALKVLLPFAWRVALARALQHRVPDRVIVWIAGRQGCEACGVSRPPGPPR